MRLAGGILGFSCLSTCWEFDDPTLCRYLLNAATTKLATPIYQAHGHGKHTLIFVLWSGCIMNA